MTNKSKEIIIRALKNAKGDDLERAKAAFSRQSPEEMKEQYGFSGRTCYQVIDDYQAARNEWQVAWDELTSLIEN